MLGGAPKDRGVGDFDNPYLCWQVREVEAAGQPWRTEASGEFSIELGELEVAVLLLRFENTQVTCAPRERMV